MVFTPPLSLYPGCQVYLPGLHVFLYAHSQGIPLYHSMQFHVKITKRWATAHEVQMPFLNKYPGDNFLRNIGVVNGPSKTIGLAKF